MIRQLLEEVKAAPLDEASRQPARRSTSLDQGAGGRAGARAGRRAGAAIAAVHRGQHSVRERAADRPGPAGRLARGPLPRHPDRDLGPSRWPPGRSSSRCGRRPARHRNARRPTRRRPDDEDSHRVPVSRAGCTCAHRPLRQDRGRTKPAEQADDHQRGTGGRQPGQAVRLGVVDLGDPRRSASGRGVPPTRCRCRAPSPPANEGAVADQSRRSDWCVERGTVHRDEEDVLASASSLPSRRRLRGERDHDVTGPTRPL